MTQKSEKKPRGSRLIRRFLPYYKPYLGILAFSLFCAVLTSALTLVFPLIVRDITDRAVSDPASLQSPLVLRMGGLYVLLLITEALARFYMSNRGHVMGAMMEKDMRRDVFAHLSQLSFSWYSNTKIGQVMSRITNDLNEITEFAHHSPEEILVAGIRLTAAFALLSGMNLRLTLIVFVALPVMLTSVFLFHRKLREAFSKARHQLGEINALTEDALLGMRVVQSFANEDLENEKFATGNEAFLRLKRYQFRVMAGYHSTTLFLSGVMNLLVILFGAAYLSRGELTPGGFASYLLYVNILLNTVTRLVDFGEQYLRGLTGLERFYGLLDAPRDIRDLPGAKELKDVKGEITLDTVSFAYPDGGGMVLEGVSLTVPPGQNVALVGPSGSGKTTLCNLIPRFYEATSGRVLVDGRDVREVTLKSLRGAVGMVQQDVFLFSGTVLENIAYGRPGASREEVEAAARRAGAHAFIAALPQGYDTYVGERGVKLSGGQRQRLSIARVFLKDPPILLLDEATSALDNESELLVQKSLEELARGRTTLTIAHRLTTIRNADVIWVLTDKGLMERGTHDELMARRGLYYDLYRLYDARRETGAEPAQEAARAV